MAREAARKQYPVLRAPRVHADEALHTQDTTTIVPMPEDPTLPTDVPPLNTGADRDMDDYKRDRSSSQLTVATAPASAHAHVCPLKCRHPESFVCGKTGEPHVISVCEFCSEAFDAEEPWCRVRRGHQHTRPGFFAPSSSASSTPIIAPATGTPPISTPPSTNEDEQANDSEMIPTAY